MSHNLLLALVVKKLKLQKLSICMRLSRKAFNCGVTAPLGGLVKNAINTAHRSLTL